MVTSDTAVFTLNFVMLLEHLNPHLNIDRVEPIIQLPMQMYLRDDDLRFFLLHFLVLVCSMSFVLAYFVGLSAFVETTTNLVDELKAANLLALSKNLALKF